MKMVKQQNEENIMQLNIIKLNTIKTRSSHGGLWKFTVHDQTTVLKHQNKKNASCNKLSSYKQYLSLLFLTWGTAATKDNNNNSSNKVLPVLKLGYSSQGQKCLGLEKLTSCHNRHTYSQLHRCKWTNHITAHTRMSICSATMTTKVC